MSDGNQVGIILLMNRPTQETVVDEIYQQVIQRLSVADRLALAQRILQELESRLRTDDSDAWTEADLRDITAYSLSYSEQASEATP